MAAAAVLLILQPQKASHGVQACSQLLLTDAALPFPLLLLQGRRSGRLADWQHTAVVAHSFIALRKRRHDSGREGKAMKEAKACLQVRWKGPFWKSLGRSSGHRGPGHQGWDARVRHEAGHSGMRAGGMCRQEGEAMRLVQ